MTVDPSRSASVQPPHPMEEPIRSQSAPQEGSPTVFLPPLPAETPVPHRGGGLLNGLLGAIVISLGFLLASFPASNGDLWLHLAAGKLFAEGAYAPGAEPFAHTTEGVTWVNSSWLYDVLVFGLYRAGGDTSLVVAKALLAALLAALLLWAGRATRQWWITAVCTVVALLAVGMRLQLQPICVSYLGLALTLGLLERGGLRSGGPAIAAFWPLLPLFAVWANLDSWFVLGPAAVALYAFGALLAGERKAAGKLAVMLVAGLAACCLNPYFGRVFRWPNELGLSDAARALRDAPLFGDLVLSPFSSAWRSSQLGAPAGWAFVALVPLGLLSFAMNREGRPWGRALLWGALLALALYQARAIPFFAVVAAPVMALNFQEGARRLAAARHDTEWEATTALKVLTVFAGLLVLVASWPGWLQAPPYQRRDWGIEREPSLLGAAVQIAHWRRDGLLGPDSRGFNFSPESAPYLAWVCPEEKSFLDARLSLFDRETADDYEVVREALLDEKGDKGDGWRDVLRRRGVDHLILYDADPNRLVPALQRLFRDSVEWPLLYADGRTAVFGWRDPQRRGEPDRFAALTLDTARAAFFPAEHEKAPASWPGRAPQPPGWLDPFVKPRPPRSLDRDAAALNLIQYDAVAPPAWHARIGAAYYSRAASPVGTTGLAGGPLVAAVDLTLRLRLGGAEPVGAGAPRPRTPLDLLARALFENELGRQGRDETALLLRALRAGRRALAANPDDATAYFILGDAYLRLAHDYPGITWQGRVPMLTQLRRAQASAALNQAILLQPRMTLAHARLASLYLEMGYLDLALEHQRAAGLNESAEALEAEVRRRKDLYEANKSFLKVADQARAALDKGLAATALQVLLEADVSAFGAEGMLLELELLLATGRVDEVRNWMAENQKPFLNAYNYAWLQARMQAATGDYDVADESLASLLGQEVTLGAEGAPSVEMRGGMALSLAVLIGSGPLPDGSNPVPAQLLQWQLFRLRGSAIAGALGSESNIAVLRGLLALESGNTDRATERFREALGIWGDGMVAAPGRIDFPGRPAAQTCLDWLTAPRKKDPP